MGEGLIEMMERHDFDALKEEFGYVIDPGCNVYFEYDEYVLHYRTE